MTERGVWVSRVLVGALVLVGVFVAVLTFVIERDSGGGQFHPDGSFVAITQEGRLEIRDGETGDMHRLLREDLAAEEFEDARITVSPDGRYAYHDAAITRCKGRDVRAVARVDLVRSFTQLFAAGRAPALSPDGRKLAYLVESFDGEVPATVLDGERPICGEPGDNDDLRELLVIRDIQTQIELRSGDQFEPLDRPMWTGDDRLLVAGGGEEEYSFVDAESGALEPTRRFDQVVVLATTDRDEFIVGAAVTHAGCAVSRMSSGDLIDVIEPKCGDTLFADVHEDGRRILIGADTAIVLGRPNDGDPVDLGRDIFAAAWLPNEGVDDE